MCHFQQGVVYYRENSLISLTWAWLSRMARMSVVPDLGTPPMKMSGVSRSYSKRVPSDPTMAVLRDAWITFEPGSAEALRQFQPDPPPEMW